MALDREKARRGALGLSSLKRRYDERHSAEQSDRMIDEVANLEIPKAPPRGGVSAVLRSSTPEALRNVMDRLPEPPFSGEDVIGALGAGFPGDVRSAAGQAPQPAAPQVPGQAAKTQAKAQTAAIAAAAVQGGVHHSGELNSPPVKAAPPSAPTAPTPNRSKDPYYSNTVPVKMPDGRVIWADPATAKSLGGQHVERDEAVARSGSREDKASQFQGAQVAIGSEGSAFLRPSTKVQLPRSPEKRPYSEQVSGLMASGPDLSDPGSDWNFRGGIEGGGGARTGDRRLSGLENAIERRRWLEHRVDQERGRELDEARFNREMALARMDPLEMERIRAQGRYGGDTAKVALDLASRQAAIEAFDEVTTKIEAARNALASAAAGSPEAARLQEYIDLLERERRERSNLIAGFRINDPRTDQFGAFFSGLTSPMGGGAGTPGSGAR